MIPAENKSLKIKYLMNTKRDRELNPLLKKQCKKESLHLQAFFFVICLYLPTTPLGGKQMLFQFQDARIFKMNTKTEVLKCSCKHLKEYFTPQGCSKFLVKPHGLLMSLGKILIIGIYVPLQIFCFETQRFQNQLLIKTLPFEKKGLIFDKQ